jgi:hypothetical protein
MQGWRGKLLTSKNENRDFKGEVKQSPFLSLSSCPYVLHFA